MDWPLPVPKDHGRLLHEGDFGTLKMYFRALRTAECVAYSGVLE